MLGICSAWRKCSCNFQTVENVLFHLRKEDVSLDLHRVVCGWRVHVFSMAAVCWEWACDEMRKIVYFGWIYICIQSWLCEYMLGPGWRVSDPRFLLLNRTRVFYFVSGISEAQHEQQKWDGSDAATLFAIIRSISLHHFIRHVNVQSNISWNYITSSCWR